MKLGDSNSKKGIDELPQKKERKKKKDFTLQNKSFGKGIHLTS